MTITKEEIEELARRPYESLTSEERKLVNLNKGFWQKGQSGNPKGRKKGCANWSTRFKKLMGDENFLKTIVSSMPAQWQDIVEDTPADLIAAGLIANITKGVAKSIKEEKPLPKDIRDAISLLNKISYGDKIVHEDPDGFFSAPVIKYEIVPEKKDKENE